MEKSNDIYYYYNFNYCAIIIIILLHNKPIKKTSVALVR
jgi:hypothetical protein